MKLSDILPARINIILAVKGFDLDMDHIDQHIDGLTPLTWLCLKGNVEGVRILLENGANPNSFVHEGKQDAFFTPLLAAAQNGNTECIKMLIEKKADINDQRGEFVSVLTLAARTGNETSVKLLLDAKVHPDNGGKKNVPPVLIAAQEGHLKALNHLLEAKANTELHPENVFHTFRLAIKNGHVACVEALLKAGANPNMEEDNLSQIMWLFYKSKGTLKQKHEILKLLIKYRANVNFQAEDNPRSKGRTALHQAASSKKNTAAHLKTLLLSGANPNICGKDGITPLYFAVAYGFEDSIGLLLQHNAKLFSKFNLPDKSKSLFECAHDTNVSHLITQEMVCALAIKYQKYKKREAAPEEALKKFIEDKITSASSSKKMAKIIEQELYNPVINNQVSKENFVTASRILRVAKQSMPAKELPDNLVSHIMSFTSDIRRQKSQAGLQKYIFPQVIAKAKKMQHEQVKVKKTRLNNIKENDCSMPMECSESKACSSSSRQVEEKQKCLADILPARILSILETPCFESKGFQSDAKIDDYNEAGLTPLMYLCGKGCAEGVKILLENKADPKRSVPSGKSQQELLYPLPLLIAAQFNQVECLKLLIANQADLHQIPPNANALGVAARYGCLESVKFLLESKMDPNVGVTNGPNNSPLAFAAQEGHLKVLKHLIKAKADTGLHTENTAPPLHRAATNGHFACVKALLKAGAKPNQLWKDSTPISFLYRNEKKQKSKNKILKLLLANRANPNLGTIEENPVFEAIHYGNTEAVDICIKYNAKLLLISRGPFRISLLEAGYNRNQDCFAMVATEVLYALSLKYSKFQISEKDPQQALKILMEEKFNKAALSSNHYWPRMENILYKPVINGAVPRECFLTAYQIVRIAKHVIPKKTLPNDIVAHIMRYTTGPVGPKKQNAVFKCFFADAVKKANQVSRQVTQVQIKIGSLAKQQQNNSIFSKLLSGFFKPANDYKPYLFSDDELWQMAEKQKPVKVAEQKRG